MGKKSKRSRNGGNTNGDSRRAPPLRDNDTPDVETTENLHFEDPYEDRFEEELVHDESNGGVTGVPGNSTDGGANSHSRDGANGHEKQHQDPQDMERIMTLNPYHAPKADEALEMDPAAYKMHFALAGEWPSLSFQLLPDAWGESRTRCPHKLLALVGTQADEARNNSLQVWKLSDLGKLPQDENDDDGFEDELDDKDEDDDDSDDDDDEDDEFDYEPVLEHTKVSHYGGVNRLRYQNGLVATWSDAGCVNFYKLDGLDSVTDQQIPKAPEFLRSHKGHGTEGYALDFSLQDKLASGSNNGSIHVSDSPSVPDSIVYQNDSKLSVEDLQWSPTENTVFAAGEAGGLVKIYDTRAKQKHMLDKRVSSTDVNALAWSKLVTNLLASGCDDGEWAVWDLRKFQDPLARFTPHTTPITSMEWHPTDESMLVVSDDVGSFVYDLSVEEDKDGSGSGKTTGDDNNNNNNGDDDPNKDLPPQLLFVHSGSPLTKEVHWHPQITSCLMSTAYDGFHIFMPSNL